MQELRKLPLESGSGELPYHSDSDTMDAPEPGHSCPANPAGSRNEIFDSARGHHCFENNSHFSAAVLVNSSCAKFVRWHESNRFASAVLLGRGSRVLVLSMYLPQPSLGLDLYTEALEAVHNLIEQVPRDLRPFNIMVGCDANCSVRNHEELGMLVGPLTHPTRWTDGDSCCTQVFVDFILRLGLRVGNTFPAAAEAEQPGTADCWTHS